MKHIKVKRTTNVTGLSKSMEKLLKADKELEVVSVGAGALNQKIKALIAVSGLFFTKGKNVKYVHSYKTIEEEITAISTKVSLEDIS